jgi:hypothetical protein
MSENLETSMVKLASSKESLSMKLIYFTKALMFYPFLMNDDRNMKSTSGGSSSASAAGDDVYPLF